MEIANLLRDELVIKDPHDYFCLVDEDVWKVINSRDLLTTIHDDLLVNPRTVPVMSMRLATGLVGELDCPSGNRGPKGYQEVVIGIGKEGVKGLLKLGALPCTTCHSGRRLSTMTEDVVEALTNNTVELDNSYNDEWLTNNYDARRLNWNVLTKLKLSPSRFYTRPNLQQDEVLQIVELFRSSTLSVPVIGFYDRAADNNFSEYTYI
jgi:hypothetical protein